MGWKIGTSAGVEGWIVSEMFQVSDHSQNIPVIGA